MNLLRYTWLEVNLDSIRHNFREIRNFVNRDVKIGSVIKANAYGHGAVEIAKVLEEVKSDYICVAGLNEAIELRNNDVKCKILVMGHTPDEVVNIALNNDIELTVFTYNQANNISNVAQKIEKKANIHIKIDTGFNRLGFKNSDDLVDILDSIYNLENINVDGIFSHLALKNEEEDSKQYNILINLINKLKEKNINIPIKHICDSIGMVAYQDYHMDMVRVGASLYGYNSRKTSLDLEPAMTLKSKIIQIKEVKKGEGVSYDYTFIAPCDMKIGTVPCGYSDGIPRLLSNKGYVFINGKKANIVGKMCMDQCMIDLSNVEDPKEGMEVVFYGENGPELLDIANLADTNRNEILAMVSRRVPRVYIENGEVKKIVDYNNTI